MKSTVEIAKNLTFAEASSRCKTDASLRIKRSSDGTGFSLMQEQETNLTAPNEYGTVECYKCSGRGRSKSGEVCTLCSCTGQIKTGPPVQLIVPVIATPIVATKNSPRDNMNISAERMDILLTSPKYASCRQCGGDGGAGGRCPRCGGNGFEPG